MRLIDADALIEKFNDAGVNITFDIPVEELLGEDVDLDDFSTLVQDAVMAYRNMAIDIIKNQPIAFDIDKVVEELEKTKTINVDVGFGTIYGTIRKEVAIEIVKQGGVADDVCEWISVSDGEFIQNPHTKRLYSNEPSMNNVYCNSCGKKIKVVE